MTRYPLYWRLSEPRAVLDGWKKSRLHRNTIPGPSSPYRVAIPADLFRPTPTSRPDVIFQIPLDWMPILNLDYRFMCRNPELWTDSIAAHTQWGTKFLGLRFKKNKTYEEKSTFFSIQNKLHWHTVIRSYSFWKAVENSSVWTFFNSSVTASWISATSAKWSPFNLHFQFGEQKIVWWR